MSPAGENELDDLTLQSSSGLTERESSIQSPRLNFQVSRTDRSTPYLQVFIAYELYGTICEHGEHEIKERRPRLG